MPRAAPNSNSLLIVHLRNDSWVFNCVSIHALIMRTSVHRASREPMQVADESTQGRVVAVLEGGYSLEDRASGSAAHVRALMGR